MSDSFRAEGNNGGDFIEVSSVFKDERDNEMIHLQVGHCCVYTINCVLPVSLLTKMLSDHILPDDDFVAEKNEYSNYWDKIQSMKTDINLSHDPEEVAYQTYKSSSINHL